MKIDAEGKVVEAIVLSGPGYGLNEAAREAARRFKFKPAKKNGEPVGTTITYSYTFLLDEIVKGYIKCRTKGGMIVDVFGIEAFLPGSQIDVKPIRDYDMYVDKTMEFKVVKINENIKNAVVSHHPARRPPDDRAAPHRAHQHPT